MTKASNRINSIAALFALPFAFALPFQAVAQAPAQVPGATVSPGAAAADFTEGEIRRIDRETGRITIRHGEIKNLQMPPMTMVFGVQDRSALDRVQVGDKIRFKATGDGGRMTVTEIQTTQ